ncbi:MAG TPA: PHP domain-containing protein [Candidatus Hydrogenedentes bacterium]|nr:PHP domain-containing protein [Candidatus Hydrogenedentota bacterium]
MAWVDLHLHSRCSDGADAPEEVVARAHALGMAALALTDHDTVAGVPAARAAAHEAGLGFLDGVEISAAFEDREIHIIGLGMCLEAPALTRLLETLHTYRATRVRRIVERLDKIGTASIDVLASRLQPVTPVGRMHVAVALMELGKATSVQNAFDRYLNRSCPAYVPKELPSAREAVEAIHDADGLAFIAHPGLGNTLCRRLDALFEMPFDGLEAWHVSHTPEMVREFQGFARARGLLLTGGSDCHGDIKKERPTMGRVKVPYTCYEHILETLLESGIRNG